MATAKKRAGKASGKTKLAFSLPPELEELRKRYRRGKPYAKPLKDHAFMLLASDAKKVDIATAIGCSPETIRLWDKERKAATPSKIDTAEAKQEIETSAVPVIVQESQAPVGCEPADSVVKNGGSDDSEKSTVTSGLSPAEIQAILDLKKKHPSMQAAQIQAQLKRFKGWRISVRAIARVLVANGYERVHRGSRPKGDEVPHRFEASCRNEIWQGDFAELRVGGEKVPLFVAMDDFSRFVVGHKLILEPTSEKVVGVLEKSIRHHGRPDAFYSDRDSLFTAWRRETSLGRFLDKNLIDHIVSRPYKPQGRGKVESLIGTIRRELWEVVHFGSIDEARVGLAAFFDHYNHSRAHMGIDGLTPADRFFGRWEKVKAQIENACRQRQGAFVFGPSSPLGYTEEPDDASGVVEALRLVVAKGNVELRLFGHRLVLGSLK